MTTRTTYPDVPIPLQIVGAVLLAILCVVLVAVGLRMTAALLSQLFPVAVVGATLWVLVRLMIDSTRD